MTIYYDYSGAAMATSAAAKAWLQTTGYGQTLTAGATTPTSLSDSYGGATLYGGSADCTFGVSDSADIVSVSSTSVVDTVNAWCSFALPTNVNNLTLESAGMTGTGNSGNDLMIALATGDTLVAGSGQDVMVDNGAGGEFFQFGANATQDVIYGFQASDVIQLTSSSFTSFAQVQSHLTQVGSDTLLSLSATQQILIRNTLASALTASNFALSVNLGSVTPTFDGEFNTLSLYDPTTGTGTWKTNFISGSQTGTNSWTSRTLQPNAEQEIYVDPNWSGSGTTAMGLNPFSVSNGVLTITATNTPTQDLSLVNNYKYTSGLLTTEKSFAQTYGYFEIKAQLPSGQGVWPAFWLLPSDGSWPPELDVFEQIGGSQIYETSHYVNSSGTATSTGFHSYLPTNSTGFHTYGVLWTPTTLAWYIDGVEVATTATPSDMNKPMYMLVNLAIGGNWPGSPSSSFTSAQMKVDYVKAYSLSSLNLPTGAAPSEINTGTTAASSGGIAPTTSADSYGANAGHALTETAAQGVLANDVDHNGLALKASLSTGPAHGTLTLNADGSFTYTPTTGFAGTDSFTYVASDSLSSSAPTTVTLNVAATAPTTHAASFGANAGHVLSETAAQGVLAGDADNNGLTLSAALATNGGPAHGSLTLNADGSFTYTPNAGFAGTDSFTYIASDSLSASAPTTVTLNVAATAPTTTAATYLAAPGTVLSETAAKGVLAGDVDHNGLTLSAALASNGGPQHGTLVLNADGSFTYTPNAGFSGTDSFTYIASDSLSSSAPTTVTLTVGTVAPSTTPSTYAAAGDVTTQVSAAQGVLASDVDHNGLTLTAALAPNGGPQHGALVLNADGSFTYTPTLGYVGADTFSYIASDSVSSSTPTTVTLNVAAQYIVGGTGNDTYHVYNSLDQVIVAAGTLNETVVADCNYLLPANVTNMVGAGTSAITLTGNGMSDIITPNTGADTLTAGSGAATFVIGLADKMETITNFTSVDKIDISAFQNAGMKPMITDHGTYTTISFSNGDAIELLGVSASSLTVHRHYIT